MQRQEEELWQSLASQPRRNYELQTPGIDLWCTHIHTPIPAQTNMLSLSFPIIQTQAHTYMYKFLYAQECYLQSATTNSAPSVSKCITSIMLFGFLISSVLIYNLWMVICPKQAYCEVSSTEN